MKVLDYLAAKGLDATQHAAEAYVRRAIRIVKEAPDSIRYGLQDELLRMALQVARQEALRSARAAQGRQQDPRPPLFSASGAQGAAAAAVLVRSVLTTLTVAGKPLKQAQRADMYDGVRNASGQERSWGIRRRFLEAIGERLTDEEATVGDAWSDDEANALWDRIRQETPGPAED